MKVLTGFSVDFQHGCDVAEINPGNHAVTSSLISQNFILYINKSLVIIPLQKAIEESGITKPQKIFKILLRCKNLFLLPQFSIFRDLNLCRCVGFSSAVSASVEGRGRWVLSGSTASSQPSAQLHVFTQATQSYHSGDSHLILWQREQSEDLYKSIELSLL